MCKCLHETMAIMLKKFLKSWPSQTPEDSLHLVDDGFATSIHSTQYTILSVLRASLDALVFLCDMLLNVPFIAEW